MLEYDSEASESQDFMKFREELGCTDEAEDEIVLSA